MNGAQEKLGVLIDELDSLSAALGMPIPDATHVQALRASLPAKVSALKDAFVEMTGENPWG
ncbi:hypothetical protein [Comamonas sp. wu1-DMT]|uniref:hypothetical protein n=1 Tax=Comamonas sp. wu1-DMT TaxID=3126390 RepID=UPI0032E3EED7